MSLESHGALVKVIDTPGTYSMDALGPDEELTVKVLRETCERGNFHILYVIDGTRISQGYNLFQQLRTARVPFSLAITMTDILQREGKQIDVEIISKELGVPVFKVDGRLGGGVHEIISQSFSWAKNQVPVKFTDLAGAQSQNFQTLDRDQWRTIFRKGIVEPQKSQSDRPSTARTRTEKLDRWLLHPIAGWIFFVGVMVSLFASIFWLAKPLMDLIDNSFGGLSEGIISTFGSNVVTHLLADGVVAGAGAILVFVPQIAILFIVLTLFEDSGYLARAATLIDRPMQAIGLTGRSFVPLLSGYACAIPAMMSARAVGGVRARLLTLFVIPLMSCSARIPVYATLLSLLFYDQPLKAGLFLTGIYLMSLVVAGLVSVLVARWLGPDRSSVFLLDLPLYRRPHLRSVFNIAFSRTRSYIRRAGPMILFLSLIIWTTTNFPNFNAKDPAERLQTSYAAQIGHWMEPALAPMGADWRIGVGLVSAFAAREVFVSALAIVFHDAPTEMASGDKPVAIPDDSASLLKNLQLARRSDGSELFNTGTVLALIVFFMIALQCLSTVTVSRTEYGSWKWPLVQLVGFNLLAYVFAVFVYKVWLLT